MGSLVIKPPALSVEGAVGRVASELLIDGEPKKLWFEFPAEYAGMVSLGTCDSFLLSVLAMAVQRGLNIEIEGALSSRLYYNTINYTLPLLYNFLTDPKKIEIKAQRLTREQWGGAGVFTAFSGGIDSFCTIIEHTGSKVPPEYKVTHFLFNNLGGHGKGAVGDQIFRDRLARVKPAIAKMGLPLIVVQSNVDEVTNVIFIHDHTLRNSAVALLFQKGCGKFLFASSRKYKDTYVGEDAGDVYDKDICHVDPYIVHLLSSETTECILSGSQHPRFEKTEIVSTSEVARDSLDVCQRPMDSRYTNCSMCYKCLRTEMSLDVIGALPRFRGSFNLDVYNKYKWLYICDIFSAPERSGDGVYMQEIIGGMKKYNYPVPRSAKIVARIVPNKLVKLTLAVCTWAQSTNPLMIVWRVLTRLPDALPRARKQLQKLFQ
ncbi:MAG: hypothetical protein WC464_05555 [Bdellovibrionales bacterium]